MSYPEVLAEPGSRVLMLGNVAIARAALEYGIGFASAYPGTPSTEIVEALAYASRRLGAPYVEWSVNEKVAFEAAYGAAASGVPALTAMKHVGLNVAADPFFSSSYTGVEAPLVVVSADDPWMWSSQNEQDNRWYGLHAYVPVVEPAGAQEAREAALEAFRLSERFKHPVLLRTTTRVSHTRVPVRVGEIDVARLRRRGRFVKDVRRWTLVPVHARERRRLLVEKWQRIEEELNKFPLNAVEGDRGARLAVVAVGLGYRYVREAVEELGVEAVIVKLSASVPLPRRLVADALSSADRVLVVEEGDPVVETLVKALVAEEGLRVRVEGKTTGLLPRYGELTPDSVARALAAVAGVEPPRREPAGRVELEIPPRPPVLCPGCPYRGAFLALRRAVSRAGVPEPVYSGDIGCYSLGLLPPFHVQDTVVEMGGSIGMANGMAHVVEGQTVVSLIGDSTFFHAGLPSLLNAVYNNAPQLVIVLDNHTTAMTGHQPHPGVGVTAMGVEYRRVEPEEAARGLGVDYVDVADAYDLRDVEDKVVRALRYVVERRRPAVLVVKGACMLVAQAAARRASARPPRYRVDRGRCRACGACYRALACPAIRRDEATGKAVVDQLLCTGCGVCAQVCPYGAIRPESEPDERWWTILRTARPG